MVKDHVLTVLTDAWIVITVRPRRRYNMMAIIVILVLLMIYPPIAFISVFFYLLYFFCRCGTDKEYREDIIKKKKAEKHVIWLSDTLYKAAEKLKREK
jgi:hypothetical protein